MLKNTAEEFITDKFLAIINRLKLSNRNKIIVLLGVPEIVVDSIDHSLFADLSGFSKELGLSFFNKSWFTQTFMELSKEKDIHVLSYGQFAHLIEYIDPGFFKDRVIIIQDNIRKVLPLRENEFVKSSTSENIEQREIELPVHHIEQFHIKNKYYYIYRDLIGEYHKEDVFIEVRNMEKTGIKVNEILDISIDPYAIDIFINDGIEKNKFNQSIGIILPEKKPINPDVITTLEKLNALMSIFGGCLVDTETEDIREDFIEKKSTIDILKKHWGENSSFRKMLVYKNPNFSSETTEISQGKIVEIIIQEYQNAKQDVPYRDLFLTAPTGAGKSLLFQLPAFHISSVGDVTIIVSPLIALMKDQVQAIIRDRKFERVAYLNSELSLVQRDQLIEQCKNGEIDILYLSPELLLSYDISFFLGGRKLGLLVIDEAHLITTWGRDFRVDYWFLGNHIRKIRKYNGYKFPMVAVTATAIYGGPNDMVFDTVDSLVMQNPHIFIGEVKRSDIIFLVNNYQKFERNYKRSKLDQTVAFIEGIVAKTDCKTLVYTPYTAQVREINDALNAKKLDVASGYYGGLDQDLKQHAYDQFKTGEKQVMVSTKAFGMGIDISDIEVVYHHAPSGLLPDYVQEIGRLARDPQLIGYAALNYSEEDKWFSKALHGMSALKPYQLIEVLKKIYKSYKKEKSQNLLISVDDFAHIFEDTFDLDQKVLTALMMIEKDYLVKHRFNVLIARPKKLFVKVFGRASNQDTQNLVNSFGNNVKIIDYPILESKGYKIVRIDLDRIWSANFSDQSFPLVKNKFYNSKLFVNVAPSLTPQLRITYSINASFSKTLKALNESFEKINVAFSQLGSSFFTETDLITKIEQQFKDSEYSLKVAKFILSNYSGRQISMSKYEDNVFIARRLSGEEYKYRLISNLHNREFGSILSRMNTVFEDKESLESIRFITNKDSNSLIYSRLGFFLELFNLGSFEIIGGENPMIFVRINDPRRIEKDISGYYQNYILKKTLERHYLSNRIFDHFFIRTFTNGERWDFIEDFFLGTDIDQLIEKHPGQESRTKIDILEYLENAVGKKKMIEQ